MVDKALKIFSAFKEYISSRKFLIRFFWLLIFIVAIEASFAHYYQIDGDTSEWFSDTIFINRFMPWSYNVGRNMRFLPFQMLDYNLVLLLPSFISRYWAVYTFLFFKFLFLLFVIYKFVKFVASYYNEKFDFFIFSFLIFVISGFKSFFELAREPVYSELIISIFFLIFYYLYMKGLSTGKVKYYLFATPFMIWTTYCKETVFSLFWFIVLVQELFKRKELTKKDHLFHLIMFLNGIIFLSLYYFIVVRGYSDEIYGNVTTLTPFVKLIKTVFKIFGNGLFLVGLVPLWILNVKSLFKKDKYFLLHVLSLVGAVYAFEFMFILRIPEWGFWYYVFSLIMTLPMIYILSFECLKWKHLKVIVTCLIVFGTFTKVRRVLRYRKRLHIEKIYRAQMDFLLPYVKKAGNKICYVDNSVWLLNDLERIFKAELRTEKPVMQLIKSKEKGKFEKCIVIMFFKKTGRDLFRYFIFNPKYEYMSFKGGRFDTFIRK